jgi:hypothetical protein
VIDIEFASGARMRVSGAGAVVLDARQRPDTREARGILTM